MLGISTAQVEFYCGCGGWRAWNKQLPMDRLRKNAPTRRLTVDKESRGLEDSSR